VASAGGGFLNRVNQGYMYVRTVPHTERTVSLHRIWDGIRHGDPLAAFRGNYSQREIIAALRQKYRKFFANGYRPQIRNIAGFNIGGGTFDIDLALRGPDLEKLAEYGETLKLRARQLGGIADVDSTLQLDKPELRVVIDPARAADLLDLRHRQGEGDGEDLHRVPVRLRALVRVHRHDSRHAVRKPHPPADHLVVAAAVGADRHARALVHGQHAQSLLRARHPRAL